MGLARLSLRDWRSRPGRSILTVLSIVVGVAAVVAVAMATQATRRAYADLYESLAGKAALQVVPNGDGGFDAELAEQLAQAPGVQVAAPVLQRSTILYFQGKKAKGLALGVDPARDAELHDYRLAAGQPLGAEPGLVLEEAFAQQLGIAVGDEVKLLTRSGLERLPVIGLVAPKQASSAANQGMIYLTLAEAQDLFQMEGEANVVYLVVDEARTEATRQAVAALLPPSIRVEIPPARSSLAEESLFAMRQGLNLAGGLSVVVSAFIIMNTFLMTVSERRRQLAIMRAIGATRRQLVTLLVREGLVMGIAGTGLGLAAGVASARGLTRVMGQIFQSRLPDAEFTPWIAALGLAVGLGVTLLACYFPARIAGRISPLEGMSGLVSEDLARPGRAAPLVGLTMFGLSAAALTAVWCGYAPFWLAIPAVLMFLVSLVFRLPLLLPPASRLIVQALRPLMGFEGQLAQGQVLRRRTRSVLTVGVLFVAISTGIGMGITVLNDSEDVNDWFEQSVGGDFFVRSMMPDMGSGTSADLPPAVGEELKQLPGVAKLRSGRFVSSKVQGFQIVVVAREFRPGDRLNLDLREGDPDDIRRRVKEGAVVIGTVLSHRTGLKFGDEVELQTVEGLQRLPIVGVANDYASAGLVVYMDREVAEKLLGVQGDDVFIVHADPAQLESLHERLRELCERHGILLQSYADVQRMVQGIKNGIVGSLWGLLVLGFVVAAFGIANTLAMNVLEQTRELGMLRVVAMTRGQLRRMILWQAIIMGLAGLVPGLLVGGVMSYTTNLSTKSAFGHAAKFELHPFLLLGVLVSAMLVVVLAAWIPAERATRLKLSLALHQE